jgi:kynurenine formamidase
LPVIDLSASIEPGMGVFPGDPPPSIEWLSAPSGDGPSLSRLSMGAHNGTHVDAPLHLFGGGLAAGSLDLGRLWGRARLAALKGPPVPREISLAEALASGLPSSGPLPIIVVATGWAPPKEGPWAWPWPSMELLGFLLEGGAKSYMTDAPGVDPMGQDGLPAHARLLGNGVPIVENLRNLHLLPINRDFTISALPIKIQGAEAAPCRAAAWLDP